MAEILVHDGTGWRQPPTRKHLQTLERAAAHGLEALIQREGALEAVVRAVHHLEDSGLFNAGLGSFLTWRPG